MLNRRISNYIFYLIIIGIIAIIFLIRSVMLGNLEEKITSLDNNNILLQTQINDKKDTVQTNKDVQEDHLYELYNQVPQTYSSTELTYLAISKLELAGIDESSEFSRVITLIPTISFSDDTILGKIQNEFDIVEVQVEFDVVDMSIVSNLIDLLNESDQVFYVNYVDFNTFDNQSSVYVTIHFLSFFEKEDLS